MVGFVRFLLLVSLLFLSIPLLGADNEAQKDDALPKGARLRLGSNRLVFRFAPNFTLLPPDYKTIVIPEVAGTIRLFDVATGRPLDKSPSTAPVGGQPVVSADGKRVVVVQTGILTVREVATGKVISQLRPSAGFSTVFSTRGVSAYLSGDGKILAQGGMGKNGNGEIIIWDVDKGIELTRFATIHTGATHPVLSQDGTKLAISAAQRPTRSPDGKVADGNDSIQVWDVANGRHLFSARLTSQYFQTRAVAFSPDGSVLAASCGDGPIDIWEVKTEKPKPLVLGKTGQGGHIAFSPDGKIIAAIASDGVIQRWNVEDGKLLETNGCPPDQAIGIIHGLVFVEQNRLLVWANSGSTPLVWEVPSGRILTQRPAHQQGIKSICFTNGGKELLTAGLDRRIVRWDLATGKAKGPVPMPQIGNFRAAPPVVSLGPDGVRAMSLALQPDGSQPMSSNAPAAVFNLATGIEEFAIPSGSIVGFSTFILPSADLSKAIRLSIPLAPMKDGTCVVWDLDTRQKLREMEIPRLPGPPPAVAVSPSGNRLVLAAYVRNSANGVPVLTVTGWDLKTGKKLGEVEDVKEHGSVSIAAADDSFALVMSGGGRLRVFDYETGRGGDEIEAFRPGGEAAGPIVFSPDGKWFAAGVATDVPNTFGVRIYEWPRGNVLHTFAGHRAPVTALAISPDGKTIASGSQDTTVLLWDLGEVKAKE